jgi:hypothetical protein
VFPGDPGWDAARQAWNLAVDQQPAAVAFPESVEDVMAVVELARREGLRIAAQGTGHNAGPLGPLEDTILVKTSRMRAVEIDAAARTARAEAGALWGEVTEAAARHGLAALPARRRTSASSATRSAGESPGSPASTASPRTASSPSSSSPWTAASCVRTATTSPTSSGHCAGRRLVRAS